MSAKYAGFGEARGAGRQARTTHPFVEPPELHSGETRHCPVLIVGGGPIGLATAIDLDRRQRGVSRTVGQVEGPDRVLRVIEQLDLNRHVV